MSKQIRIDADVLAALQRLAVEYGMQFATPNHVLRRLLEITPPAPDDAQQPGCYYCTPCMRDVPLEHRNVCPHRGADLNLRRQLADEQAEAQRDCGDAGEWDSDGVRS